MIFRTHRPRLQSAVLVGLGTAVGLALGGLPTRNGGKGRASGENGIASIPLISAVVASSGSLPAEVRHLIDEIWERRTQTEQIALAAAFAGVSDPESIRMILDHIHLLPGGLTAQIAEATLLRSWLRIAPEDAIGWSRAHARHLICPAFESWAYADPDATRTLALTFNVQREFGEIVGGVLKGLTARDPTAALDFLREIGLRGDASTSTLGDALHDLAERDVEGLLDCADELPAPIRWQCRHAAAAALAARDPTVALEWLKAQPDREDLSQSLFRTLPPDSWPVALEFATTLGDETLDRLEFTITVGWGAIDPERTLPLLLELPKSDRCLERLVEMWRRRDPQAAADAFQALGIASIAPEATLTIGRALAKLDAVSARSWADSLADPTVRDEVFTAIDRVDSGDGEAKFPRSAEELVDRLLLHDPGSETLDRHGLPRAEQWRIASVLTDLPPSDAARAAAAFLADRELTLPFPELGSILANVPATAEMGDSFVVAADRLARQWADQVPEEAVRWAETLPAGSVLNSAASAIARNWKYYDPAAARAWAGSLQDESARAAALGALGQQ